MNAVSQIDSLYSITGNLQNESNNTLGKTLKLLSITALALIVTLLLFWLMSRVISQTGEAPPKGTPYVAINAVYNEKEIETHINKRLPQPPEMLAPPKVPSRALEPNENENTSEFGSVFEVASPDVETSPHTALNMGGGDARPIVRISPQYPITAARDGIEGWVQLTFTINELGGVEDVQIIDAEPKRVFNREATRALRKWKYRPKMVDGNPVKQVNMSVQLDFKLQGNSAQ